jgi:hypothetical protein
MKLAAHLGLSFLLVAAVLLALGAAAHAAPKPIRGKLSKPGYTVVALAPNGEATAVRLRRRRFRLAPPAKRATLHLRAPRGVYAGPVVLGRAKKGKRAILGVRAGARLGKVKVRRGYAKVARRPPAEWIDARRIARAKKGVPIGARVFGRVRSRIVRDKVPGDVDFDGIPAPLDIDDDGDLIIDNLDRSPAGRGGRPAQVDGCGPDDIYCQFVSSGLSLSLVTTVNANAGSTEQEIDAALGLNGGLRFSVQRGRPVELDCAGHPELDPPIHGLLYCSPGGTGVASAGARPAPPFPGEPGDPDGFDPDGDGFGVLDLELEPFAGGTFLLHGARARRGLVPDPVISEIGSGDQFLRYEATDGDTEDCPPPPDTTNDACVTSTETLGYVFATVPALVSYSDTAGNSADVAYPVVQGPCTPGCPPPPGANNNGFVVAPGPPDGDVRVTLTFWRPQRRAIPDSDPPGATWMDVGGLTYGVGTQGHTGFCPQEAFSEDDPNLTTAPSDVFLQGGGGFYDTKPDLPSSPGDTSAGRTFTYTLNLTDCLADAGLPFGDEQMLTLTGVPGAANFASQTVSFRLPSGIIVRKQTSPAESPTTGTEFDFHMIDSAGGFDFKLRHDGTRTFDLPPGNYTVQEVATPGYDPPAIDCDDADSNGSGNQANFHVSGGEYVTCTFTNTKSQP